MCGINGFNFEDKKLITLMNKTISHRGPDDKGYYLDKNVSLGHLRLSIIDLSKNGHQPMWYKRGKNELYITYNGEIYNFEEIKLELEKRNYKFKSNCDTEVILAAYLEWGVDCVKKFNGMWAFCIYDKKKKELFLSRDRFGKKPLYYYKNEIDKRFIFSSELKSILKTGIKKEIDKNAFEQTLTYRFAFDEKTLIKNIFNFRPAHNMIYNLKTNEITYYKKYYDIDSIAKTSVSLSLKDAKNKTLNLLEDSVRKRMVSDVPVATLLSGGIDSSLITYFAKKYNPKLNTFSIGFDTTNELPYAKIVAKHLKTNHKEFKITKDNLLKYLDKMVYHMDEPIGADPGFLPIYVLSKEVSKYNRVVLTGDGADEIFIGYDRYKLFYYGKLLKHFALFKTNNEIINRLNSMRHKNHFEAFTEISRVFEDSELKKLNLKSQVDKTSWTSIKTKNSMTKSQIYDIKTLLPKDLFMKSDKMSSAFGLEQRTPFMDFRLVEHALSLPIFHKLRGWNEKFIIKQIAKDLLPSEIVKRRKHGFNVPIDYWFKNVLAQKLISVMESNNHSLYKKDYIYELLEKMRNSKSTFKSRYIIAQKLWTVLMFEMWYEKFIK